MASGKKRKMEHFLMDDVSLGQVEEEGGKKNEAIPPPTGLTPSMPLVTNEFTFPDFPVEYKQDRKTIVEESDTLTPQVTTVDLSPLVFLRELRFMKRGGNAQDAESQAKMVMDLSARISAKGAVTRVILNSMELPIAFYILLPPIESPSSTMTTSALTSQASANAPKKADSNSDKGSSETDNTASSWLSTIQIEGPRISYNSAFLSNVCAHPTYDNKDITTNLVLNAIEQARQLWPRAINLEMNVPVSASKAEQAVFRELGFKVLTVEDSVIRFTKYLVGADSDSSFPSSTSAS